MKRKTYFSFAAGRVIAGLIVAGMVFAGLSFYLHSVYDQSLFDGFTSIGEKYRDMTESYADGKFGDVFIDIFTDLYCSDYIKIAEVNEDGSFETVYETDYRVCPLEKGIREWFYITDDEELLALGDRTDVINDNDWTIHYVKSSEIGSIDFDYDPYLGNSWNETALSDAYSYSNGFYRAASEFGSLFQYRLPSVETYYVEGNTLHIGKVIEVDGYGTGFLGSRSKDFTDPSKADLYINQDGDIVQMMDIYRLTPRPDRFLEQHSDIFLAKNTSELFRLKAEEDDRVWSDTEDYHKYKASLRDNGLFVQGQLEIFEHNGKQYMLEYVITALPYTEYFKPVLIFLAVILFILGAGIPLLLAIRPYHQYKKAYESNIFKNNLIDALAHNMKTPLQILGGYAENLKDVEDSAEKNRYAERILTKTSEMNRDIEGILRSAEKSDISLTKTPVRACIEEAASKAGAEVGIKGDGVIKADREYFNMALFNLIDNAAKYKTAGSKIEAVITKNGITITNKTGADKFTPGTGLAIAGRILEQQKLYLGTSLKDGVFEARIGKKPGKN